MDYRIKRSGVNPLQCILEYKKMVDKVNWHTAVHAPVYWNIKVVDQVIWHTADHAPFKFFFFRLIFS